MRFVRRLLAPFTGSRVASFLQIVALGIGVFVVFEFLGWVWALVGFAVALLVVSFAIDGGSK